MAESAQRDKLFPRLARTKRANALSSSFRNLHNHRNFQRRLATRAALANGDLGMFAPQIKLSRDRMSANRAENLP